MILGSSSYHTSITPPVFPVNTKPPVPSIANLIFFSIFFQHRRISCFDGRICVNFFYQKGILLPRGDVFLHHATIRAKIFHFSKLFFSPQIIKFYTLNPTSTKWVSFQHVQKYFLAIFCHFYVLPLQPILGKNQCIILFYNDK